MARAVFTVLRALQLVLSLTSLGLSSYVVHWYMMGSRAASPAPFNFLIFTSIFSVLSVVYLEAAPRFAPRISHPYATIAVEMANTAFYFGAFIALAIFIGGLVFCQGTVCSVSRADTVVAAGQFTAWIGTTAFTAKEMFVRSGTPTKDINHEMQQA
ncbi:hypothetical protein AK830_g12097 [Neonectria ditissima]|uniref:MARVEL domain-containing protein n=1 Tax=Neonectria ditissima TaxID=78410 RepID=A0A0P7B161_9HYPO|nr:hypothetical protein AK830_g12097 [Neonectria ditissima]